MMRVRIFFGKKIPVEGLSHMINERKKRMHSVTFKVLNKMIKKKYIYIPYVKHQGSAKVYIYSKKNLLQFIKTGNLFIGILQLLNNIGNIGYC